MEFHKDVWASGQMGSKLWLCEELERAYQGPEATVWILGGWHGLTAQLLFLRDKLKIKKIRSFDIDPSCEAVADQLNNLWVWQEWRFKAFTFDCNELDYNDPDMWASDCPDIVINTAVEHFHSTLWWQRIPSETLCLLQSNNMKHADHISSCQSAEDLATTFEMKRKLYQGRLDFDYQNESSFSRFMVIGYR